MVLPLETENIIKILGIESLPDERKEQIVSKVADLVQKRLLVRVVESLSPEQQSEFTTLLEQNDAPALQEFMQKSVPGFADMLFEEVSRIKQELGELAEKIPNTAV